MTDLSRVAQRVYYLQCKSGASTKKVVNFTENVLLAYFPKRSNTIKPSSLWSEYSMKLIAFVKQNSVGFRPKKSKVFSREHIYKFLKEAPDSQSLQYLASQGHRRDELQKLSIEDIEEVGSILIIVKGPQGQKLTKNEVLLYIHIYHKYTKLRPNHTPHKRFLSITEIKRAFAVNTFAKIPYEIAQFLHSENPELY
ncbi:hypothetical protein NQ317_008985 [Molorchus minor]|uniref:Uncharacterized protein n=1 Tax=Molorchus minor TaxID=1323400 RepID=A0ABQ9J7G7_9CUCU|nr:hypothetical protein NQ317_008985 [Molorchus minor]